MNNTGSSITANVVRCGAHLGIALLGLAAAPHLAFAALTDISPTPLAANAAVDAKPNIMLLMDASGSMGWSHMPDEVESITGITSIGYKSAQCNVLYYNPQTEYKLPKKPDGTFFPTPVFGSAPYAGFVSYFATPDATDLSTVDLAAGFRAYDAKTLRATSGPPPDPAQQGYYYVYAGAQTLGYAAPPCVQSDTLAINASGSVAADGGGTWTRVLVDGSSGPPGRVDERANFAIWYSFYRTRLSLIKSAASLAFTPLTDSFRVGFITVEPKDTPTSPAINPSRYVPIADFDTAQRNLWFGKLFAQSAGGASPTREGLARVGRHYAGMQDGINTGMTGDPIQFSCQQNFTILTTDGYWNSQTETPGRGPVKIDGVTRVGQQDGTLTSNAGLSPRPIWEGFAGDTQVETDNNNSFSYLACGSFFSASTSQTSRSTMQLTATTSQLTQSMVQTTASTEQISAQTSQLTQSTLQHTQSTAQISQSTSQLSRSTSQLTESISQLQQIITQIQSRQERIEASTSQQSRSTSQLTRSTSQQTQSTLQTRVATSQVTQSTSQTTASTSQLVRSTSQLLSSTTQINRSTLQQTSSTHQERRSTSQLRSCNALTEECTPVPSGSCTPGGNITCETIETGPTSVVSCQPATANSSNNFTATTCGIINSSPTAVASCAPDAARAGNGYTATICNPISTGPTPVASCTAAAADSSNNYTQTSCVTNTNPSTAVASCTAAIADSGNGYTATDCSNVTSGPTGVAACTASAADSGNSYVATTCNTLTTGPAGVAACANAPAGSGNSYVASTCNTVNTGPAAVSSCTPAAAGSGNSWVATTCDAVTTGPTPVAACSPSSGTAGNGWTNTTCPNVVGVPVGVASCTPAPGDSGNSYTATVCGTATTGPTGVASCTAAPADSGNGYVATACNTLATGPTPIASCSNAAADSGNGYTATTCATVPTGPTPVASCSPAAPDASNGYTETVCATILVQDWTNAASCSPVAPGSGNGYTSTSCRTQNSAPVGVANCTPSPPDGSGAGVTCNTAASGPTGVASCVPQTGDAGNGWLTRTCATLTSGPTLVAACAPESASGTNQWTGATCAEAATGPTLVAACTPDVANAGNSYTSTTCSTNSTGPTGVSSCTPVAANSGNGYTATTCNDVASGPTPVGACSPTSANSGNLWLETTCLTNNTGPTPVAACSPATANGSNGWTGTTCSSVVTGPTGVSSCSPQAADGTNSYVSTTCNTTASPAVGVAACTPVIASSDNNWTETRCTTVPGSSGVATCTPASADGSNNWTSTNCSTVPTGPTLVASCTPAPANSGNGWLATTCNTTTTGPTATGSCTPAAADAGNNYTATTCSAADGKKIQYATTTRITTSQFSGGNPVGSPVTTTSTGALIDFDGVCYAPGTEPALPVPNPERAGLTRGPNPPSGCSAWPCTVATANAGGSINSLADVAQYYYATDLRPSMADNVPAVGGGPEDDRAAWQHMTTFTIALGVSGTLNYRPDYKSSAATTGDFAEIRTGPRVWPVWPDPALNYDGNSGGDFRLWNNPRSIDDFWHTAVNGRGTYFSAGDPRSVIAGLSDALAGTAAREGSGAGVAVSNFEPVAGDNFSYSPSYQTSKWVGDVKAAEIDTTSGVVSTTINWSAQALLDTQTRALCDNRSIYLMHPGAPDNKVNFSWNTRACDGSGNPTGPPDTGLDVAERASFGSLNVSLLSQYLGMTPDQRIAAADENLVNFLRGQRGFEGFVPGNASQLYRSRAHVLGDIVGGQPVYVKAPFASYQDPGYGAFKTANAGRTPMVYVPANDGMLHAFYAGTSSTDVMGGKEAWAFIPTAVLPNLYKLADDNYKNNHQFFVDGTPVVGDAYNGSAWKTILVGGLNAGGKSYYAVDVTDPAAPKGLWEFKRSSTCYDGTPATAGADCHLGYTFGKPVISKVGATWVVMFTSGYNNVNAPPISGDGVGYLYVLNAFTGQIIYKIATGVGDAATPSGLAQINNYVDYTGLNNTTKQVYGGDLLGNVWRFDVNDTIAPSGREAALIGTAKDVGGIPQPITTRPELAELNAKPMVFVGTGRLLGATDFVDRRAQSVYGFVDPLTAGPVYTDLRAAMKPLAMTQVGSGSTAYRTVACTGSSVQCGAAAGWVVDLPDAGERVNIDMKLARGTLVFASNVPSDNACTTGGYSWLNYLSFSSGLAVTTNNNNLQASVQSTDSLAVGLNLIGVQGRLIGVRRFSNAINVNRDPIPFDPPGPTGKRISWREIAQ